MSTPPRAKRVEHVREHHGDRVVDDYEWLRDKDDPEVIAHLEAENACTDGAHRPPRAAARADLRGDQGAHPGDRPVACPAADRGWWYYRRTFEGKQYRRQCRGPRSCPATGPPPMLEAGRRRPTGEQVLLDGNALAEGHEFFSLGGVRGRAPTAPARLLHRRRRRRALHAAGQGPRHRRAARRRDRRTSATACAWSLDGRYVFYTTVDDAWRPDKVWRHRLGTPGRGRRAGLPRARRAVLGRAWAAPAATGSSSSRAAPRLTTEIRLLDADDPAGEPRVVAAAPRGRRVRRRARASATRTALILHNDGAADFELATAPLDATAPDAVDAARAARAGRPARGRRRVRRPPRRVTSAATG